mgnify:CR=1 FL=1
MAEYQCLKVETRGRVGIITLYRPEALNAADARMHTELVQVWETINRDPSVNVVVVTGAGASSAAPQRVGVAPPPARLPASSSWLFWRSKTWDGRSSARNAVLIS